jgi:O-antigen/teichoic acid export membrane protein
MSATEAVARNAVLKCAAHGTRVLSIAFLVLAARALGPVEFGRLTFAYALAVLLAAVLDLGMHPVLIRSMVREPGATARHWMDGATLKLILLVPAGAVLAATPLVMGVDRAECLAVWLLGLAFACQSFTELSVSVFAAAGRFGLDVAVRAVEKSVLLGVGLLVLAAGGGVVGVAATFVLASVVALVGSVVLVNRGFARVPAAIVVRHGSALARRLGPVAVASVLDIAKPRLIAMFVFVIAGEAASGYFGAGTRVMDILLALPAAVVAAAYPALAGMGPADPAFRRLVRRVLAVLLAFGLVIALALHLGGGTVTRLVFGAAYAPVTPILSLVGVATVLAFTNYFLTAVLLAIDRPRRLVTVSLIGTAATVVVTPIIVAQWGAVGGGVALIVLEAITAVVSLVALSPFVSWSRAGAALRAGRASTTLSP